MPPACLDFKLIYHPPPKSKIGMSLTHHSQTTDKICCPGKPINALMPENNIGNLGLIFHSHTLAAQGGLNISVGFGKAKACWSPFSFHIHYCHFNVFLKHSFVLFLWQSVQFIMFLFPFWASHHRQFFTKCLDPLFKLFSISFKFGLSWQGIS